MAITDRKDPGEGAATAALPAPALPKGGGAIRGIGEKLAVNPATGTGAITLPIATSPGRAGFHPELSLAYDSGSGNGPFGIGWALALPSISRKTDKGLPRYLDGAESDTFILSGAEDLVPALRLAGAGWELDVLFDAAAGEDVVRYRPRVEGAYARIERRTPRSSGQAYWQATTRDDVTHVYGKSAGARIADPLDPRRVFRWLLETTSDDKGNIVAYEYRLEDRYGVADRLCERNRQPTNAYPKKISYGNDRPGVAADFHFLVIFDYGEHTSDTPDEPARWAGRADPFSSYRAGFEIRTYRLCQRVLMFHQFTAELGAAPYLVRSTDFAYDEATASVTYLRSATQTGYLGVESGAKPRSLPALELAYVAPGAASAVQALDPAALENLPYGLDGKRYRLTDLDGEGLAGILIEEPEAWYYKRNRGGGDFGPIERVAPRPAGAEVGAGFELTDLAGDGHKYLVRHATPGAGHFERTAPDGWGRFHPFAAVPNLAWNDPNLRFVDLDGDGLADVLVTEDEVVRWYRSLGKRGFAPAERVPKPLDEEQGPRVVFADGTETLLLADLSGDGLTDLVRVRSGEVCYWPNLGYGRFGAKVTMENAPAFEATGAFDPKRVRFADIDGSGTADLVYLDGDGARYWLNLAGNGFGAEVRVAGFPPFDTVTSVEVVDLLGAGTACLVWSSPLPGQAPAPVRYVDLMGGVKPHLLSRVTNNLGAVTELAYVPSTKFYLEDRAQGRPWITRLPFVVHVVQSVTTRDDVTGTRLVKTYAYHHGYYDGFEREFRGFGMVEEQDAETFEAYQESGGAALEADLHAPPVLTRSWFHTGAYVDADAISRHMAREYYDPGGPLLPDTVFPDGPALTVEEAREAVRALRGHLLHQEVYALDGDKDLGPHPYVVTEQNFTLQRVQPMLGAPHGVFAAQPRETIVMHHERVHDDPRVTHEVVLEVDALGVVRKQASIAYARRVPQIEEQGRTLATYVEHEVVHLVDDPAAYRVGAPVEARTYELTGLGELGRPYLFAELLGVPAATRIAYHEQPGQGPTLRLVEHTHQRYWKDDLSGPLDLGLVEPLALSYETYQLALTAALMADAYGPLAPFGVDVASRLTPDSGPDGSAPSVGYFTLGGDRWIRSGHAVPSKDLFCQAEELHDPFGGVSHVTYDVHALLLERHQDPLGNLVQADNDYRTLAPWQVTDPNDNRTAVAVDPLGLVIATAVMGKATGPVEGDTLSDPTTTLEYALDNWSSKGQPNYVRVLAREEHGVPTRYQETITYADGLGREVQKKAKAEPGDAPFVDPVTGKLDHKSVDPRWVGTGRTVFDNKGNPVKKYEPFFSTTSDYEAEPQLVAWGVTPILRYDPLGRLVRTENPNGTFSSVAFDAWEQVTSDENDNVLDPACTWYTDRQKRLVGDPERRAADLAAKHAGTPATARLDPLGRTVRAVADNGGGQLFETRTALDIQGNVLAVTDARGIVVAQHRFDVAKRQIASHSVDAGDRWVLLDAAGKPLCGWGSRAFEIRHEVDALRRPTHTWVTDLNLTADPILAERTVYGEAHPTAKAQNLLGKPYRVFDGAGVVTTGAYDFKGNLLSSARRLAGDYHGTPDWSGAAALTAADALPPAVELKLQPETEVLTTQTAYDALNRVTHHLTPDKSDAHSIYNEAGLLEQLDVQLGAATAVTTFIKDVDYNEKAQRLKVVHGNDVVTTYRYETDTFRLAEMTTLGGGGATLQHRQYTYDPVGNIVEIDDRADQGLFFAGPVVEQPALYEYDPTYRLLSATGREHPGQTPQDQTFAPNPRTLLDPNDASLIKRYRETYAYDEVGNLGQLAHQTMNGNGWNPKWTRDYTYESAADLQNRAPEFVPLRRAEREFRAITCSSECWEFSRFPPVEGA